MKSPSCGIPLNHFTRIVSYGAYCTFSVEIQVKSVTVGSPVAVGATGLGVGGVVGFGVGGPVGFCVADLVGFSVGDLVGFGVSDVVGFSVGGLVGLGVGDVVGLVLGGIVAVLSFFGRNILNKKCLIVGVDTAVFSVGDLVGLVVGLGKGRINRLKVGRSLF